jgi:hypothetical protein
MKKMSSAHEDKVTDLQNKIRSLQVILLNRWIKTGVFKKGDMNRLQI